MYRFSFGKGQQGGFSKLGNPSASDCHPFDSVCRVAVEPREAGGKSMFYEFPKDFKTIQPIKGFLGRVVSGKNMMFSHVTMEARTEAPLHAHPHEQMGIILEGTFEMTIGEETRMLGKGDIYRVPPDVTHGGKTRHERALILDVFSPPRDDYK
jgi:quercetin dioxygenase-like cupin family protein